MDGRNAPPDGALPFSDVTGLLAAAASAEKQQALVARIYVAPPTGSTSSSSSIDQFAQLSLVAARLRQLAREQSHSSPDLGTDQYIWHREPPAISIVSPPASSRPSTSKQAAQPAHILFHLRTGGECMEDEWFATHMLLRASASSELTEYALCISIEDEDGQFLLIEAAEHLPDWVTPESAINRVWVYGGHLHLVAPHHADNSGDAIPILRAIDLVRDPSVLTRAPDDVEAAALARAYEYPSIASRHHHRTLAYLPRQVARALGAEPQLIASCVAAIQSRDPLSSRSASRLVRFPPPTQPSSSASIASAPPQDQPSSDDIVLTRVRMTRHLYAQLLHDRFFPPRQLGPQWQAAVERYRMHVRSHSSSQSGPKIQDEAQVQAEIAHGRWHDLGAKIWCGLEMAFAESSARRTRSGGRSLNPQAAIPAAERQKLLASLTKLGFFQGELQGSAKWKQLETQALAQYAQTSTADVDCEQSSLCETVDRILSGSDSSIPAVQSYPPEAALRELRRQEDDDAWLHLSPGDVESILAAKSGPNQEAPRAVDEQDAFQRLGAFNKKMAAFLETKSDVRGAVFEDEAEAMLDDDELLFEDEDEEEQERRIRVQVSQRLERDGEEAKRKMLERLLPRMSDTEWLRPTCSSTAKGNAGFVDSIDALFASRAPPPVAREGTVVAGNHLSAAEGELRRRLASQYMRDTSALLSSQGHEHIDGADESDGEIEEEVEPEVRRQRAQEYDTDPDVPDFAESDVQDGPEAWDEETEVGNMLEFARISLGLSKEQYEEILSDRKQRGKFVPFQSGAAKTSAPQTPKPAKVAKAARVDEAEMQEQVQDVDMSTFEDVMAAMDRRLNSLKTTSASSTTPQAQEGASKPDDVDAELLSHLVASEDDLPASLESLLGRGDAVEAEQLASFLRSFQAQSGAAATGPVQQLMQRFGLGSLPADQDPI
ncbi:MADS box transcription factor [Moesziomyces antarcticus T-34]|uniref:MADS box transcription factor n=1 Tax=Pseudozyma antarctica (strain T-34) TaxID=1151754 RepID=M9M0Z9_PSEA3|nr:MADS box transcription factor [Moesziomyces antarcticus T-34]